MNCVSGVKLLSSEHEWKISVETLIETFVAFSLRDEGESPEMVSINSIVKFG